MRNKNGFILVGVMILFVFLLIIVPVMVRWAQHDSRLSMKDQKSSLAFSLAEAAVDRGYWKVKGSTGTFAAVAAGDALAGYNFDTTYRDVEGGSYRISVSSGPGDDQITIIGEGRDNLNQETRAIKAVYTNTTVPGAILTRGALNASGSSVVHWGPVMAMADIVVSGGALINGYPRKLSRQTVLPASNFDSTGDTNPPNTDSVEWWSNYNVPELPVFDFSTMRSSAAATGTLNCQTVEITTETYTYTNTCTGSGCVDSGSNCSCTSDGCTGLGCVDSGWHCDCSGGCYGSGCYDSGKNCSCHDACWGSGCTDSGKHCNCSGSGAAKVCVGSGCHDSGANCDCGQACTGSGCHDSGANCDCSNTCTGTGCHDSGANCDCSGTCTGSGCVDSGANCDCTVSVTTHTATSTVFACCHSPYLDGPITCDYPPYSSVGCTDCDVQNLYYKTTLRDKDYTWYWDHNASWSGRNGLRGTMVVRGNLSIDGGDYYCNGCTVKVPEQAWKEYQKYDTSSSNQYPADIGLSSNSVTYTFGSNGSGSCSGSPSLITRGELWRMPCGSSGLGADLGVYGFLYIGGTFTRTGDSDIYGAMWVEGDVIGSGNTMVFYDSHLKLPTLNVVLERNSWQEVPANAASWL